MIKRRWHQINDVIILFGCCMDFQECWGGDQEERDSYHVQMHQGMSFNPISVSDSFLSFFFKAHIVHKHM